MLFLEFDGSVKSHHFITADVAGFTSSLQPSAYFGNSAGVLGELSDDGSMDLVVGAVGQNAVYILFTNSDVLGHNLRSICM